MQPQTTIAETILCTASENVDSHPVLCAVEELSLSSTETAIKNRYPLLDFDKYMGVEL